MRKLQNYVKSQTSGPLVQSLSLATTVQVVQTPRAILALLMRVTNAFFLAISAGSIGARLVIMFQCAGRETPLRKVAWAEIKVDGIPLG
jgi:hypothetical protein